MPRKKQSVTPVPGAITPARVRCPACQSEISGDGSTLHARSKWLEDLIEEAGSVPELEKALEQLEAKYQAAKEGEEKAKEKAAVAAQTKPEAANHVEGQTEGHQRRGSSSWW